MSDLALQLIAKNKRSKEPFLDLGNCGLREIPAEVAELLWLESLSLSEHWAIWEEGPQWTTVRTRNSGDANRRLTSLSPLAGLSALKSLYLSQPTTDGTREPQIDLTPITELSALQSLYLSDSQITELPQLAGLPGLQSLFVAGSQISNLAPVVSLSALRVINISSTETAELLPLAGLLVLEAIFGWRAKISDLTPVAKLPALRILYIPETKVKDLGPVASIHSLELLDVSTTAIADLAPVTRLPTLKMLRIASTKVRDLEPLTRISTLQSLKISETVVDDLAPLAGLSALQELDASHTHIRTLSTLAGLSNLQELDVSDTQISDLSPLAGLPNLKNINVSKSQVTSLSPLIELIRQNIAVKWSSQRWQGDGIYVEDCPLVSPPPEIAKQGNEAVLNYLRERALGKVDHLYEAKMLILGEGGAGKTSLLTRLYQPGQPLPGEKDTTRGITIHKHTFTMRGGQSFRLNIWDFGGQEIYHATHQFFLTHRSLYLLVDDTRKDNKSVSDDGFKYWLELIDVFGGHSPTLIFQNEKGGRSKAIDIAGIKGRYDNVKDLYAGNLERGDAVNELRDGIEFQASHLSHIGEELPAPWIKVRKEIEQRAGETQYISLQEYFDIYSRHMEFDRSRAMWLSRYLHDLGVFLHFQDDALLTRTVILQNQWATEAVFRILDDETVKANLGRFSDDDCKRLWRDSAYADMHPELLALMQNFELCYELRDSRPPTWLAPELLPPAKPETLVGWGKPEDLVLRYKYEFLPKGVISRLTVRLHRFVRNSKMAWITGVLFERDSTAVLVEVLAKGDEIELRAHGPEHKALLSVIAADIDALNDSFQGLRNRVDKRIPCNCKVCRAGFLPEFFGQRALLKRKQDNRLKVECPRSYEDVDVLELLDGVRLDKMPGWANDTSIMTTPRTIRIFLASSSELREDRDAFDLYFRQQNDHLRKEGLYLEIIRWENFLDAMSETRLQDKYNKAIRECDIFVSLFFTKTGKFTEEEFEIAHRQFKNTGKPLIYTYFKNADIKTGSARKEDLDSLWAFQEKLDKLGHFRTNYDNIEHLKRQFDDQLEKLQEEHGSAF